MPLEGLQVDRYKLIRLLRRGGMSEIYLAEDTRMPRQVAVKVMQTEGSLYPTADATHDASRLFEREMRAVTTLDSPYILPLLDFGGQVVNGTQITYMVMPFRPEGSLADWLRQRTNAAPLSVADVAYIIHQAGEGLQHAHDHQIIHLDVKPSNLLVRHRQETPNRPDVMLADFGIAKFTGASKGSNAVRGTLEYMAPEQWTGQPGPASDQYALAVTAYELLTGRPPFQGNVAQLINQHYTAQPQPPSSLNPRIPSAVDMVILNALRKRPEERYPSIRAFVDALQQAALTNPVQMNPRPTPPPVPPPQPVTGKDVHVTLSLNPVEAMTGGIRPVTLQGNRLINVSVPAHAYNGQSIRLDGYGEPSPVGGMPGALIINILIVNAQPQPPYLPVPPVPVPPPPPRKANIPLLIGIPALIILVIGAGLYAILPHVGILTQGQIAATATATTSHNNPDPYQSSGKLAFFDSMSTQDDTWPTDPHCSFTGGAYHIVETTAKIYYPCYANNLTFSNFAFEATMKLVKGDCGGLIFRANNITGKLYLYRFCYDSRYRFTLYIDNSGTDATDIANQPSSIIKPGYVTNTIAVVANGNTFDLYANGQNIDTVTDSTYSSGRIALFAEDISNSAEVAFSNVRIWTL